MVLIYGGAYQGKLDYARERYGISDGEIFYCSDNSAEPVITQRCVYDYQKLVLAQIRSGFDPVAYFNRNIELMREKIIICDDISSGVVPIDAETRLWRESVGRCMNLIAKNADEVWRIFCGIGTRLK